MGSRIRYRLEARVLAIFVVKGLNATPYISYGGVQRPMQKYLRVARMSCMNSDVSVEIVSYYAGIYQHMPASILASEYTVFIFNC